MFELERRQFIKGIGAALAVASGGAFAGPSSPDDDQARIQTAVLYPDLGEPYRSVFNDVIEGVEDRFKGRVQTYTLGPAPSSSLLGDELRRRNIRTLIALGRAGVQAATPLDKQFNVIAGCVLHVPEAEVPNMLVQSLAPDPSLLFARVRLLAPWIKRVVVVYDPKSNDWLMRVAREAARAQGLDLVSYESDDIKTALRHYQDVLGWMSPKRDALWLPQDSTTVDDATVLPLVLKESWAQGFVVFSSNASHIRRGVLFSLYPDNVDMGRTMASHSANLLSGVTQARGRVPLKQVLNAANIRTAHHLGIDLRATSLRLEMVYPEQ